MNSVTKIRIGTDTSVTDGFWTIDSYDPSEPAFFATYGLTGGNKYSYFPNLVELEINQEIPIDTFEYGGVCSHLEKLTIGTSIEGFGTSLATFPTTFCPNLKEITLNGNINTTDGYIFGESTHLSSITYPTSANGTLKWDIIDPGIGAGDPFTVTVPSGFNFITSTEEPYLTFSCYGGRATYTFEGRTIAQLQAMPGYPWGLNNPPHNGVTVHCSDGDITFDPSTDS